MPARVLISAYACEPGKGSEPEVGWQWAIHLANHCQTTVVTRANNRPLIEEQLKRHSNNSSTRQLSFVFFDLPCFFLALKRWGLIPATLYYVLWQVGIAWKFRSKASSFDVIHHITFNAFQVPGFWWLRHPCIVLGPLGGGQITSWAYLPLFRWGSPFELFRSVMVFLTRLNPLARLSFSRAKLILVANHDTLMHLPIKARTKAATLLETGIDPGRVSSATQEDKSPLAVWIGRMEKRKAGVIAIRALHVARSSGSRLKLMMIGDGPENQFLQNEAARLKLEDAILFAGKLPLEEVYRKLAESWMLLFTSVRDTSGNVVLEAMAQSKPVVAIRHQGVAEMAADDCCLFVESDSISKTIEGFADAMAQLELNSELRAKMGEAGVQRIRDHFLWESKAKRMFEYYQEMLGE